MIRKTKANTTRKYSQEKYTLQKLERFSMLRCNDPYKYCLYYKSAWKMIVPSSGSMTLRAVYDTENAHASKTDYVTGATETDLQEDGGFDTPKFLRHQ